jgi:DNA-binding NarL/FixJ family response regulator
VVLAVNDEPSDVAVLLVDDQDLVRSGLRRILRRKDGFTIVAECSDEDEVPDAVAAHRPDVVVMDLRMKRVDGIEATSRLSADGGPPVLALTTFNDDELLSGALRAGAAGFVLKDSSAEELIRAVRAVAGGDSFLETAVTARVLTTYRSAAAPPPTKPVADVSARARCAHVDPEGMFQRRNRRRAWHFQRHRQKPHRPHLRQAGPARPCRRDCVRL